MGSRSPGKQGSSFGFAKKHGITSRNHKYIKDIYLKYQLNLCCLGFFLGGGATEENNVSLIWHVVAVLPDTHQTSKNGFI
jgi:hypothetical protein